MGCSIAIDGPAGAGKSTIAKRVARALSFIYVDTGAMYRAVALYLLREGVGRGQPEAIAGKCTGAEVSIRYDGGEQIVLLNGEDVNSLIRTEEVGNMASVCSAIPEVRIHLLKLQRSLAEDHDVVMDGRDIGTTILPHAQVKIYLTASAETRAARREKELSEKGGPVDYQKILQDIIDRDYRDMHREISPLVQAEDALLVDSSEMSIEKVTDEILGIYRERTGRG